LPGNIFCRFEIIGHQQKLKFENLALFSASLGLDKYTTFAAGRRI